MQWKESPIEKVDNGEPEIHYTFICMFKNSMFRYCMVMTYVLLSNTELEDDLMVTLSSLYEGHYVSGAANHRIILSLFYEKVNSNKSLKIMLHS